MKPSPFTDNYLFKCASDTKRGKNTNNTKNGPSSYVIVCKYIRYYVRLTHLTSMTVTKCHERKLKFRLNLNYSHITVMEKHQHYFMKCTFEKCISSLIKFVTTVLP